MDREGVQEDANISATHTLKQDLQQDTMYVVNVKYRVVCLCREPKWF